MEPIWLAQETKQGCDHRARRRRRKNFFPRGRLTDIRLAQKIFQKSHVLFLALALRLGTLCDKEP